MQKDGRKQGKKRAKKDKKEPVSNAHETGLNLKCIEAGCESKKIFPSVLSLASHIRAAHRKQYTAKQLEGLLMSDKEKVEETTTNNEEVEEVSKQESEVGSIDLSTVMAKIDEVSSKIPANLCEKFPELCELGGKVDKISGDVEEMKGQQIKKLVLQVPKTIDTPKVDLSGLKSTADKLSDSIADVNSKLDKIVDDKGKTQTKQTKKVVEEKDTEKDETSVQTIEQTVEKKPEKETKDIASLVEEAVNEAVKEAKSGSDNHNVSADDIVNCPHCKSKILGKIADQSKDRKVLDPVVMHFMESMGFVKREEEKGVNNANKETDNDENTDEGSLPRSAQSSPKTGNVTEQEVPKPETTGSEQRTESKQGLNGTKAKGEGTGARPSEAKPTEAKGEGNDTGTGAGAAAGDGDVPGNESGSGNEQPAGPTEPKRCRLLYGPGRY